MRALVEAEQDGLTVLEQCELLGLARSTYYYVPQEESVENLELMRLIDEQYLKTPFYGSRKMVLHLRDRGHVVNRKRVGRLMRLMGLEAIYRRPRTSDPGSGHHVYPYLLSDLLIERPDQVWAADITYIPMRRGFQYLVALMDWYSRYVLSWRLSNTLEVAFCVDALADALERRRPEIFNTDQGSQFTSAAFTGRLQQAQIRISMDGQGRVRDNIFIERLWRSVKYEDVYLRSYEDGWALQDGLDRYFEFYNHERYHQGLGNQRPAEVYFGRS